MTDHKAATLNTKKQTIGLAPLDNESQFRQLQHGNELTIAKIWISF